MLERIWHFMREMLAVGLPTVAVFACFWPYRKRALDAMGQKTAAFREVGLSLFLFFLFAVLGAALWPVYSFTKEGVLQLFVGPFFANVNLIPGRMFLDYFYELGNGNLEFVVINFLGNMLVFVPLGLFPALLWARPSWKRALAVGLGTSLFIELSQYFLGRSSDVDDLILNTLGALCGYWLFLLLRRLAPKFTAKFRCKKLEVPDGRKTGDRSAPHGADPGKL